MKNDEKMRADEKKDEDIDVPRLLWTTERVSREGSCSTSQG